MKPLFWTDMPSKTTVTQKGVTTVSVRTTGHEINRLTVCLAAKADGSKPPQYVIIPHKKVDSNLQSIPNVIVACSDNGWMNEDLTDDWVDRVFGNMAFGGKRLLVWDTFAPL